MPRWLLIAGLLAAGNAMPGPAVAADDTLDLLPDWHFQRPRAATAGARTSARGPTGASPRPERLTDQNLNDQNAAPRPHTPPAETRTTPRPPDLVIPDARAQPINRHGQSTGRTQAAGSATPRTPAYADDAVEPSSFQRQPLSEVAVIGGAIDMSPGPPGPVHTNKQQAAALADSSASMASTDRSASPAGPATVADGGAHGAPAMGTADAPPNAGARLLGRPRGDATPNDRSPPLLDGSWTRLTGESAVTVGASLAVVVGLLLLLAWVWRRAAPRSAQPLPADVVSIVGRVALANRQVAQLMKVGGKLVLVCVTADGVEPITEVTDPEEVARLLGLCEQNNPRSASMAFQEVFDQLAREPVGPGFLGADEPLVDRQKLADAYANTPGGRAYG